MGPSGYVGLAKLFDSIYCRLLDLNEIMMPNRALSSCISFSAGLLLAGAFSPTIALYGALMILCTYSSQAAYNNIRDVDSDRINAPHRPLARGSVSIGSAWALMGALVALGFAFSFLISPAFILVNALFVALGLAYSRFTKAVHFLSYATLVTTHYVLPLASAYILFQGLDMKIAFIAAFIYLTEIFAISIKDYKDMEGDAKVGMNTLPILIGPARAARLTFIGFSLPFFLAWVPWALMGLSGLFLALYMLGGAAKIYVGRRLIHAPSPEVASSVLKDYRYIIMLQMLAWCCA